MQRRRALIHQSLTDQLHCAQDKGQPAHREALPDGLRSRQRAPRAPARGDKPGALWRENGLIFASETGEPLSRQHVTAHRFKPLLKRTGLPEIRFHDLRHTCATLLLSENVNPKVVSEMLGHASITITLNIYAHVLPDMQDSAANAMEAALGGVL